MLPNMKTSVNIRLPFSFIFFGIVSLLLSQWILVFQGDILTRGIFREPSIWMSAHLLILGWGVMVVMGAMYQLVPVAFLTPIWSEKLGFFQFGVTSIGITLLTLSFGFQIDWIEIAGGITVIGIMMFIIQMLFTLRKQQKANVMTLFVGGALLFLLLTILLGITMAINVVSGFSGIDHMMMLKSHVLFGLFGWFSFIIFGFSYKMVPMFALSHGFSMKLSSWVFGTYFLGIVVTEMSILLNWPNMLSLGSLLLFVGFGLFHFHMRHILKKSLKKQLDKGFSFGLFAIKIGTVIHAGLLIASFFPSERLIGILLYAYVIGWITFSIMGYLFKIVPFLWWTERYSAQIGKTAVPTLKQMMDEKTGFVVFITLTVGLIGVISSLLLQNHFVFTFSQLLIAVAVTIYSLMTAKVLTK